MKLADDMELFRQNQFAFGGDAKPIILTIVNQNDLARLLEQSGSIESLRRHVPAGHRSVPAILARMRHGLAYVHLAAGGRLSARQRGGESGRFGFTLSQRTLARHDDLFSQRKAAAAPWAFPECPIDTGGRWRAHWVGRELPISLDLDALVIYAIAGADQHQFPRWNFSWVPLPWPKN